MPTVPDSPKVPNLADLMGVAKTAPKPAPELIVPPAPDLSLIAAVPEKPKVGQSEEILPPKLAVAEPTTPDDQTATVVRVQLKDCPPYDFPLSEVHDKYGAIKAYEKINGILATINPYQVQYLAEVVYPCPKM